jgi:Ni/Fe-hydrogenase subunit HybB-like protein
LPLLFLLSAFAVGYPMVIVETNLATTSLGLSSEMEVLAPLSRFTIVTLGLYMALKLWDLLNRGVLARAFDGTLAANSFLAEVGLGVILPWTLLLFPSVRRSRRGLFFAALLIVGGVLLNRVNVFLVAYTPQTGTIPYFPSIGEILVTAGAVATIMFLYRTLVTFAPVLSAPKQEEMTR